VRLGVGGGDLGLVVVGGVVGVRGIEQGEKRIGAEREKSIEVLKLVDGGVAVLR